MLENIKKIKINKFFKIIGVEPWSWGEKRWNFFWFKPWYWIKLGMAYLVLEHLSPKCPHTCKCEVQFVEFFRAVRGRGLGCQKTLQKVAQHLDVGSVCYGRDLLETSLQDFQTGRDILWKKWKLVSTSPEQLNAAALSICRAWKIGKP